ncbi:HAAS domain-containing protein [Pontibacillus sp. HMF3514]|uniref:HAAS signaling domain-containing protein n=1 Tax=Pontibacillus sp. HMF3514 TaxID=2692425 RepID=UPI00131FDA34|nr:DUF1700 domain-containing protein [Pontibacillus sp. HMF3514]QHE53995.1 DUF1700 domain-containing protein [Pontibacillus sp. HMF3514]
MNQKSFLSNMKHELKGMSQKEQQEILSDYTEHFEAGKLEGRTEDEIAQELGDPKGIAKDLMMNSRLEKAEQQHSFTNIMRAVLATVSLSFFNLVIVLGPAIALFAIYITLWCLSFSLVLGGVALLFNVLLGNSISTLTNLFTFSALSGLGLIVGVVMTYISKPLYKAALSYMKWNVKIAKGEQVA